MAQLMVRETKGNKFQFKIFKDNERLGDDERLREGWEILRCYEDEDELSDSLMTYFITWYKLAFSNVANSQNIDMLLMLWLNAWEDLFAFQERCPMTLFLQLRIALARVYIDMQDGKIDESKAFTQADNFIVKYREQYKM
jgi:hypothetical protein